MTLKVIETTLGADNTPHVIPGRNDRCEPGIQNPAWRFWSAISGGADSIEERRHFRFQARGRTPAMARRTS
jgi:hypothetical protein